MHPAVAALPFGEKGLVLGALLARMPPESFLTRFGAGAGVRGRSALEALGAESRSARAATLAELIALVRSPVPAGVERIHPDWLRERLTPEQSAVIRLVTAGLPAEVLRVAEEIMIARGEQSTGSATASAAGAAELRRHVFSGLVPLAEPGGPTGPIAAPLMSLPLAAVTEAIETRGAETLGISLRGAPSPVVARAAVNLGEQLARSLLEAAARAGSLEERAAARRLVEQVAGEKPRTLGASDLAARLGARSLAIALGPEGREAALAVGQRLPLTLGRQLLAFFDSAAG
ncbi:MAG TPA: hypothetical protein VI456_00815 [Polyangia bacterium]